MTYNAPNPASGAGWSSATGGRVVSTYDRTRCIDTASGQIVWASCTGAAAQSWAFASPAYTPPAPPPSVPPLATAIVTAYTAPQWSLTMSAAGALTNTGGTATPGSLVLFGPAAVISNPAGFYLPQYGSACIPGLPLTGGAVTVAVWAFINRLSPSTQTQNVFTLAKATDCSDPSGWTVSPYPNMGLHVVGTSAALDGQAFSYNWQPMTAGFFSGLQFGGWALFTFTIDSAAGGAGGALYRGATRSATFPGLTFPATGTGALWLGWLGTTAVWNGVDMCAPLPNPPSCTHPPHPRAPSFCTRILQPRAALLGVDVCVVMRC